MEKKREIYEKRSEILTKKLLSKIYAMEASYLESRMNARESMDEISEKVSDWEKQMKDLSNEREKLNQLYQNMVNASKDKWDDASAAFEEYAEKVNAEKQNFYERTEGWLNDMGAWINDLEDRARKSSGQLRDQLLNQVEYLKKQQDNLRKKAKELQKTTGENWEKVTTNISNEVKAMRTSITNAYQHFFPSGKDEKGTSEA
jgi:hypothetical protein